jgi:hypothetical protein
MDFLKRIFGLVGAPPVRAETRDDPPPTPRPRLPKGTLSVETAWDTSRDPATPTHGRMLILRGDDFTVLPGPIAADISADLQDCRKLKTLPGPLKTGSLNLTNCVSLEALPDGLNVAFLDLRGCISLKALPHDLRLGGGRLNLRDCPQIRALPDNLGAVAELNLSGCLNLKTLPEGLSVTSWIDVGSTSITALPARFADVGVHWNGVAITHQIAFAPETLKATDILAERNTELRRVMIERFGYDKFMAAVNAVELDRDRDAGGERRLLRVELAEDEPLVCVSVICPSTGHKFLLRVPPMFTTCHAAIAWTAGFDNPNDYKPAIET